MNGTQRIIKCVAVILAIFIIASIINVIFNFVSYFINDDKYNVKDFYQEYQNINEIKINSSISKIIIQKGDKISVDASNVIDNLKVTLENNVLNIEEENKKIWNKKYNGVITITVDETMLNKLEIEHGTGLLEIDRINVKEFDLEHGAGKVEISNVTSQDTKINGGAGEIIIYSSNLSNLDFDIGAGKTSIEALINGKSEINCGVGALDINLLGNKEDYQITVSKGIGKISIDGNNQKNNTTYGNGNSAIILNGGVGSITVQFK